MRYAKSAFAASGLVLLPIAGAAQERETPKKAANDPLTAAAHAAGEPSLQEILDKLGYSIDVLKDEIPAQRFRKAGKGQVTHEPIAAYGLIQICSGGWYLAPRPLTDDSPEIKMPEKNVQWRVDAPNNKRAAPPLMPDAKPTFDPGKETFGVWVSTAGFKDETVFTQNALQKFAPRFKASDRHKAMVFTMKKGGKIVPNAFIIGWEYSTNNDFQDIVTMITNVNPIIADK